jgi:hypothetical protein
MRYADIIKESLVRKTVYHGSPTFDGATQISLGHPGLFYVTDDLEYAKDYARRGYISVFSMQMQNPLDLRVAQNIEEAYQIYSANPPDVDEPYNIETDAGEEWALLVSEDVVNHFKQKGFDGFVINESSNGLSYAITNPARQLKLISVEKSQQMMPK